MIDRLVLGTVQLGMPYGINNEIGKPDFNNACDILNSAVSQGITRFDTAQGYGDSESVLGKVFDKLKVGTRVKVYSKLRTGMDFSREDIIKKSVEDSLISLRIGQLEGLLIHNEDDLSFWNNGLGTSLRKLVREGKVRFIGASFYSPQKALDALGFNGLDFIQVPANILDNRFEEAGVFEKARECGKKVFIRSIFLQGLLLIPLDRVPASLKQVLPYLEQLEQMACSMKLTRMELALGYVAQRWSESFLIFGAESSKQVADNVRGFLSRTALKADKNTFNDVPEIVLNPALWPKLG
jgi:aryl-alcohol dehydrogenase-like predicted oxidoreductase